MCVLVQGAAWQFKGWEWDQPVTLFQHGKPRPFYRDATANVYAVVDEYRPNPPSHSSSIPGIFIFDEYIYIYISDVRSSAVFRR